MRGCTREDERGRDGREQDGDKNGQRREKRKSSFLSLSLSKKDKADQLMTLSRPLIFTWAQQQVWPYGPSWWCCFLDLGEDVYVGVWRVSDRFGATTDGLFGEFLRFAGVVVVGVFPAGMAAF
jgi:hypothetical protein